MDMTRRAQSIKRHREGVTDLYLLALNRDEE